MTRFFFICWLLINPTSADACGWWDDAESDYSDDAILVDSKDTRARDESNSIDDAEVQTRLGNSFKTSKGAARNYKDAVYWYRKAAEQNFAPAQNNLAVMYEKGLGVPKDQSEAAKWYQRAAEGRDSRAQHSLGIMYRDGRGVSRNPDLAVKWIQKSAEQGHPGAFRDMGEMYWKGSDVQQNSVLACMWWKLGSMHGDRESGRLLIKASEKMDSGSVIEAEKMALEWMRKNK